MDEEGDAKMSSALKRERKRTRERCAARKHDAFVGESVTQGERGSCRKEGLPEAWRGELLIHHGLLGGFPWRSAG